MDTFFCPIGVWIREVPLYHSFPPSLPPSLFRSIDLSFNHITTISGLEGVVQLKSLFLIQNKISKIENISHFTQLTMLELGANRIRVREIMIFPNHALCSFS